jgi:hypothetical protein
LEAKSTLNLQVQHLLAMLIASLAEGSYEYDTPEVEAEVASDRIDGLSDLGGRSTEIFQG